MKTKLKVLTGLVLLIFLTASLTLAALAETSDKDEALFNHEEVGLAPGGIGASAVINVDTTTDELNNDGDCSLREAIQAANTNAVVDDCTAGGSNDTIILASDTYILTLGDLRITSTLTISGTGANSTIIDGNNSSRVFRIQPTGVATISDVTLTKGNGVGDTNKGGAIWIFHGVLTLLNSTVTSNTTVNNDGGGILNEQGTLTIDNSIISNNTGFGGGGVANRDGTVTINNTTISGNTALAGGLVNPGIGVGGGVSNVAITADSTLTINQSTITTNTATGTGGGGVNNNASGTNHTATTTLNQTVVSGNDAAPVNALVNSTTGFGGGIRNGFADPANGATAAIVVVNNSAISDNKAINAGGIGNGTVSVTSTLTLKTTLNNTTVNGNTTPNHNGGTLQGNGGGLVNVNGTLSLVNSTVSGNAATGSHATGGQGGGIFSGDLGAATTLWLTNTTISGNTAQVSAKGDGVANIQTGSTATSNFKNSIINGGCLNSGGALTSHGNNLDDDNTCNLTATGDITNTSPLLGLLQDNGGPTLGATGATAPMLTHALLAGSPALGAGDQGVCAAAPVSNLDQRGVTRPATDAACDIGAYESDLPGSSGSGNVYLPIVIKS